MSDIIDFMERMGGDATLSQASADELAEVLSSSDLAPEFQSAVIARNASHLGALMGTNPACMLVAPPHPPGPPGPTPMRPAVPPPPDETEEDEETKGVSLHEGVAESPALGCELQRI